MSEKEMPMHTVVFIGTATVMDGKKKKSAGMILPADRLDTCKTIEDATNTASCFTTLKGHPGNLYMVAGDVDEDGKIVRVRGLLKAIGERANNRELTVQLELRERAAKLEKQAAAAEQKLGSEIDRVLRPLAKQYVRTNYAGKLAIEVLLLQSLRKARGIG